jgi:hypothetical protein
VFTALCYTYLSQANLRVAPSVDRVTTTTAMDVCDNGSVMHAAATASGGNSDTTAVINDSGLLGGSTADTVTETSDTTTSSDEPTSSDASSEVLTDTSTADSVLRLMHAALSSDQCSSSTNAIHDAEESMVFDVDCDAEQEATGSSAVSDRAPALAQTCSLAPVVLLDLFHALQRIIRLAHKSHGAYMPFIARLREAFSVMLSSDVDAAIAAYEQRHAAASQTELARAVERDFAVITQHCPVSVPSDPAVLLRRFDEVILAFCNVMDGTTGMLLHTLARVINIIVLLVLIHE